MPRSGGTYTIPNGDFTPGTAISSADMDENFADIATEITNSVAVDGQSTMTGQLKAASGTVSAPGISFGSDLDCGAYRIGANNIGIAVNGAKVLDIGTAGLGVTGTVTSSGAVLASASDGAALGSATVMWSDLFLASGAVINFNNGDVTITHSANSLAIAGGTSYTFDAKILPATDDGAALGDTSNRWSDLHLASGGVINWAGNVTVTHSAGLLTVVGGMSIGTTLGVTGAATLSSTLAVTGASTLTGALTANNSAGITGRNTIKAFGKVVNQALVAGSFNVASVVDNGANHTITFTNAMANANYAIILTLDGDNSPTPSVNLRYHTVAAGSFLVEGAQATVSNNLDPDSYSFMVLSNE